MAKSRLSKEYKDEVELFIKSAIENGVGHNIISCPYTECGNF